MDFVLLALRWMHFIGGFTWFSTVFLFAFSWNWVDATVASDRRFLSKISRTAIVSSMMAILAGVVMGLIKSGLNGEVFLGTQWGISILAGGFTALTILALQFSYIFPYLEAGQPELAEKARVLSRLNAYLAFLVLLFMALSASPL